MNALDCLPFAMQPAVKKATFQITNPENKAAAEKALKAFGADLRDRVVVAQW